MVTCAFSFLQLGLDPGAGLGENIKVGGVGIWVQAASTNIVTRQALRPQHVRETVEGLELGSLSGPQLQERNGQSHFWYERHDEAREGWTLASVLHR